MSTLEFDSAITEVASRLKAFIRKRVPDDATAEDLAQETLLKVYRSRATLRESDRLEAWLYRIARRTLIDYYRRRRPTEELPASLTEESQHDLAAIRRAILASTLRFLEDLPEPYRIPVKLAEIDGLSLGNIALRLGLSLTAVKSRVRRGRDMLKKKLQECCRFEFDQQGTVIDFERRQKECCAPNVSCD